MKLLLVLAGALLLVGCASNPIAKFYTDHSLKWPAEGRNRLQPYSGSTRVIITSDPQREINLTLQAGLMCIGESNFDGAVDVTEDSLREQGEAVGADIVIYSNRSIGPHTMTVPVINFVPGQTSTTNTYGQTNFQGTRGQPLGTANYTGQSQTTTQPTFSSSSRTVDYERFSYVSSYWRKTKPLILGVRTDNLSDDLRRILKRNTGALITIVMDGTPAFYANLLVGDIIIAANEHPVLDGAVSEWVQKLAGQKVTLTIIRDGEEKKIDVQLNSLTP